MRRWKKKDSPAQHTKTKIVDIGVKLEGRLETREFQIGPMTVLKCTQCRYFIVFDCVAEFATKEL